MIKGIDITENRSRIAIVVVGYNRLKSIKRLLESLLKADYSRDNVPLVISIDCSGDEALYEYVKAFNWPYGDKYLNIQQERLGLKNHIYQCGDLTRFFKAVILLEDDLFVSPHYYSYTEKVVTYYGDNPQIAEISLYKNETNGFVGLPIDIMQTGNDVFLMQDVSTWGQCWTEAMWNEFKKWRDSHTEEDVLAVEMPQQIKNWTRAWSKYYNAYVVATGKYVLYPNHSITTNFSDAGEHGDDNNSLVQVNLLQSDFEYRLNPVEKLIKYDIYGNNELLYEWLGLKKEEVRLDLYGMLETEEKKHFIFSTRNLPYKKIKSYALNMRPMELNVKYGIPGEGLTLYDTTVHSKNKKGYHRDLAPYMLRGYHPKELLKYVMRFYKTIIKKRIR